MKRFTDAVRIPLGLRSRTLDFYVAFLVFFLGASGFVDPTWPERFGNGVVYWVVMIEDTYLIIASISIMASLILREFHNHQRNLLIPSIVGEMFGWLFVSAAAAVIVITSWWIPLSAIVDESNPLSVWLWLLVWVGLGISSFFRYLDLRVHYRNHK